MAENFDANLESEKERLAVQKQINEYVKSQVTSFSSLGKYSGDILKNYKDIQETNYRIKKNQQEIERLSKSTNELEKQRGAALHQENEELKKQRDQMTAINKEMAKGSNILKGSFNSLLGLIKTSLTSYLDFDQKARDVAANVGLGANRMGLMRQNVINSKDAMAKYGVTIDNALDLQQAYSDELGRSVILSESALVNIAQIGKATGLGVVGMGGLVSKMELFGMGAQTSSEYIMKMYSESAAMGLNAGKVIKKFEANLGLLNRLNFKDGVNGLKQMSKLSEKFKISMESVASAADKVFRPEGAIEAAAILQTLGGEIAALGDPMTLLFRARNAPEELAKSLTKAASASAKFNDKTKEFEVNANEMDRLREMATALNMDFNNLVETAKQGAKISQMGGMLGGKGLTPEESEAITMMANMEKGKAQIEFIDKNGVKFLGDLKTMSGDQLRQALEKKKEAEEAAQQATGVKQQWEAALNQLSMTMYPIFEQLMPKVKEWTDKMATWVTKFFEGVSSFLQSPIIKSILKFVGEHSMLIASAVVVAKALGPLFSAAGWFLKGMMLSKGFDAGQSGGSFLKKLGMMFGGKGGAGAAAAATAGSMGPLTKSGKPDLRYKSNKMIPLSSGTQELTKQTTAMNSQSQSMSKMGSAASVSAGQILAFGAAILMIGGGIWLAADGLSHLVAAFKDLTGPQALGAVAAIAVVMGGFVAIMYAMGPAILAIGEAGTFGAIGLLAFGVSMLMVGGGIALAAWGLSVLVDSFTAMFAVIGSNGSGLLSAGVGFMAMAAGIGVLTMSLIGLGAASFLALPGLLILGGVTSMLTNTAAALQASGGSSGISSTIEAINSVDKDKLEALKELSMFMALLGGTTTIKFDENLTVDGNIQISGQAGGKTNTDWIDDAMFISALKEKIMKNSSSERTAPGRNQ